MCTGRESIVEAVRVLGYTQSHQWTDLRRKDLRNPVTKWQSKGRKLLQLQVVWHEKQRHLDCFMWLDTSWLILAFSLKCTLWFHGSCQSSHHFFFWNSIQPVLQEVPCAWRPRNVPKSSTVGRIVGRWKLKCMQAAFWSTWSQLPLVFHVSKTSLGFCCQGRQRISPSSRFHEVSRTQKLLSLSIKQSARRTSTEPQG